MPPTLPVLTGAVNLFVPANALLIIVINCSKLSGLFASFQNTLVFCKDKF